MVLERENIIIDFNHKKIDFSVNEFYLIRRVSHECFLSFPLPRMVNFTIGRFFFILIWFWDFEQIFGLFNVIEGIIKMSRVFSGYFWSNNRLKIKFLGKKNYDAVFLQYFGHRNTSFFCFFNWIFYFQFYFSISN